MDKNKGFTLIELIIVVAIIAIIAAIAIPGLVRARMASNEGSAVATLKTLATSQAQFRDQAQVDQDEDGAGEYGLLGELAGTKSRRGNPNNPGGLFISNPSFVTSVLGPSAGSFSAKAGYNFQIFLPGTSAANAITDDGNIAPTPFLTAADQSTIDIQEIQFRVYAWPVSYNTTGNRCFAVDSGAGVMTASNSTPLYTGPNSTIPFSAAVASTDNDAANTFEGSFRGNVLAKDGQTWTAAGN